MNGFVIPLVRAAAAALLVSVFFTMGGDARLVAGSAGAPPRPISALPGLAAQTGAAVLVPIGAQVAGTVLKVDVPERRYVTAGTVLVELNPGGYRAALAQARSRVATLEAQISAAQDALAAGRRQAAAGVTVALGSAKTTPTIPSPRPVVVPPPSAETKARLARAQQQIVAARSEVLSDAQSAAVSAKQALDRDQKLLAEGLIAAQQIQSDTAAYNDAQGQVAAAQVALKQAHSGTARAAGSVAQAQQAIATAQRDLSAARADAAVAEQAVDRDTALAAQGAVAVHQLTADTVTRDAARARVQAATAELQRAQAELVAAQAEAAAAEAARRQAEGIRQAEAVRAQHVAQTRTLAQQAAFNIATAARRAETLAALQTEAVNAEAAVQRAAADLAETVIRSPADGWVTWPLAVPGQRVRPGDAVATLAVDSRHETGMTAAAKAAGAAPAKRAGVPSLTATRAAGGASQLAQIAAHEREVLAQLSAEAVQISSISASGIPEVPPPPGTALSAPDSAEQPGGTVPTLLNGGMPWPILGAVTSGYGWRIHPIFDTPEFHTGVDIAASMGSPIEAPAGGTVIFAGSLPANGTLVILDHGNGVTTTYSHLSAYRVYIGEHVQRGQVIAGVGSTGWSTGPHLFFEIRKNGHPVNPLSQ